MNIPLSSSIWQLQFHQTELNKEQNKCKIWKSWQRSQYHVKIFGPMDKILPGCSSDPVQVS